MLAPPELIGRNINYFVPEHRLSEEPVERLAAMAGENGPRGLVIYGRAQKCSDSDGDICLKPDIAEQIARLARRQSLRNPLLPQSKSEGQW